MEKFVERMMVEHADLTLRINSLHNYVYSEKSDKDNKVEFANKCIQLAAMKKYEEALRARLENQHVFFENGQYFERIANVVAINTDSVKGSDNDIDGTSNE